MGWICDGIPKDGLEHPEGSGSHAPYDNPDNAPFCFKCELPKTAVVIEDNLTHSASRSATGSGIQVNPKLLGILLLGIPIAFGFGTFVLPPILDKVSRNLPSNPIDSPSPSNSPDSVSTACLDKSVEFSSGEQDIFQDTVIYDAELGMEAFAKKEYEDAKKRFNTEIVNNPIRPELVIYRNNTVARLAKVQPFKIAAVVSIQKRGDSALEVLRGIADAQTAFNQKQAGSSPLLEIVIYNEADSREQSQCVAQTIVKDESILAVIGHSSSTLSREALPFYTEADLAMIAPTSTSTQLKGTNFFRAVPSDAAAGKTLAKYILEDLKTDLKAIAVFYAAGDTYSESLYNAFVESLGQKDIQTIDLARDDFDPKAEIDALFKDKIQLAVLLPSTDTRPRVIGLANESKQRLKLLGGDTLYDPEILKQGGNNIEGLVLAIPWYESPNLNTKNYAYRASEQWKGWINWRTASSYDATQALLKILTDLEGETIDRQTLIDKLEEVQLSQEQTAGFDLDFEDGERQTEPLLVEVCSKAPKPVDVGFGFVLAGNCTRQITPPTERPYVPPTERPYVPPTERPYVPPTERPYVPPTERPEVIPTPVDCKVLKLCPPST